MIAQNDDNVIHEDTVALDEPLQNSTSYEHSELSLMKNIDRTSTEDSVKRISLLTTEICSSSERQEYFKAHHCQNKTRRRLNTKRIIVNDKLKIAYCAIAKIGSSTFKTLMALSGPRGTMRKVQAKKGHMHAKGVLRSFGLRFVPIQAVREFDTYHKIVIWRHPFTRLVSAYKDKFTNKKRSNEGIQRKMHAYLKRRKKPRRYDDWRVAFDEFIDAVVHGHRNQHWDPFEDHCNMCHIEYDSVLRLETFSHDIPSVLDVLGLDISTLNSFSKNRKRSNSTVSNKRDTEDVVHTDVLKEFNNFSSSNIQALRRKYRNDLIGLGYEFDSKSKATSCRINTGSDICC